MPHRAEYSALWGIFTWYYITFKNFPNNFRKNY